MSIFVAALSNKSIEKTYKTRWWFGTFFIFPYIGNVIIPPDELIFFRGVETTNQKKMAKNVGHDVFGLQRGTHFPSDLDLHKLLALIWV